MRLTFFCLLASGTLLISGCATECCSKPEVVYVDKYVSECTRTVQRITQVSPCATCSRFPISARFGDACGL
jgi:hypothetical protein